MKTPNTAFTFLGGTLLGISLTLCLAAAEKTAAPTAKSSLPLQITGYPNGSTGIYDPESGRLYIYDANQVNCVAIREISSLGAPLRRIRN